MLNRRKLIMRGGALLSGSLVAAVPRSLLALPPFDLDVASAGSIRPMIEGPLQGAAAADLGLRLRSHAQGADAVAQSLVNGSLRADVFLSITSSPMRTVMRAGMAQRAQAIARTELVLVYSSKSRFASRFAATAAGNAQWWEVLQEPGIRLARSNPAADPSGRCIIFTLMLAARKYNQPDLVVGYWVRRSTRSRFSLAET